MEAARLDTLSLKHDACFLVVPFVTRLVKSSRDGTGSVDSWVDAPTGNVPTIHRHLEE